MEVPNENQATSAKYIPPKKKHFKSKNKESFSERSSFGKQKYSSPYLRPIQFVKATEQNEDNSGERATISDPQTTDSKEAVRSSNSVDPKTKLKSDQKEIPPSKPTILVDDLAKQIPRKKSTKKKGQSEKVSFLKTLFSD